MNRTAVDVEAARCLAHRLLGRTGDRWRHTIGVAAQAEQIAHTIGPGDQRDLLVAAAWLHDIGYAPELRVTDFHPLDGAMYLDRAGWPARVCGLVAHHSGARFVARARGLLGLLHPFRDEASEISDALTYADQTTGPQGQSMRIEQRLAEVLDRHGTDSPTAAVHHVRAPYLLDTWRRVERRRTA